MEKSEPIRHAVKEFQSFVKAYPGHDPVDSQYLAEYLEAWLELGNGFETTGRKYGTFLRVALNVADAAMRGEIHWHFNGNDEKEPFERNPVIAIHDPEAIGGSCFDPVQFDVLLTQRTFGLLGMEAGLKQTYPQ